MSICRTCLLLPESTGRLHDLFAVEAQIHLRLLTDCTSLPVSKGDGLPSYICSGCFAQLASFRAFCKQAVKADKWHRNSLCLVKFELSSTPRIDGQDEQQHQQTDEKANWESSTETRILDNVKAAVIKSEEAQSSAEEFYDHDDIEGRSNNAHNVTDEDIELSTKPHQPPQKHRTANGDKTANKPAKYTCDLCSARFRLKHLLAGHLRQQHCGLPPFPCDSCPLQFTNYHQLRHHRTAQHQPDSLANRPFRYTCDMCGKRFKLKHFLAGHVRQHCGLRPFPCEMCPREFDSHIWLVYHRRRRHDPDEPTVCPHAGCGKTYRRPALAHNHYERVHLRRRPKKRTDCICEQCGKAFGALADLQQHKRTHLSADQYAFGCEVCGKRMATKQGYKLHVLRHENVRNYACPLCPSRMVSEQELKTHVANHDRSVRWPCGECEMVFQRKPTLLQHQRLVHRNVRRFVCRYCNRDFNIKASWVNHERRHTGERPFPCTLCNVAFVRQSLLKEHMKTKKHRDNMSRVL